MRVPALQTVTLFSNFVDTNTDCTQLICDGWLEIKFPDAEVAQDTLSSVIMLRATWQNLLQLRLQGTVFFVDFFIVLFCLLTYITFAQAYK